MHLIKEIDGENYATSDNRYGIDRAGWYWICWRIILGRKVYYQRQISAQLREPIYFKNFTSASEFLGQEIESDKAKIIYSA